MPTSEGHKPSSNNEKGSNDRPSSIGACNTAISPHNINPQTRPTLLYSTHQIAPNHLTTDTPTSGAILLDGARIDRLPANKRGIGMVFQNYALFPHMTVGENLAFPLTVRRRGKAAITDRVRQVLDMVRLPGIESRRPDQLSGGQQQRVAVARALIFEPSLVLMDEPLGALDKQLREQMQFEIKDIHARLGVTFIYVTHDQTEALTMSNRIAVFNAGRLQQVCPPAELYERPRTAFVAGFIGENNRLLGKIKSVGIDGEVMVELESGLTIPALSQIGVPALDTPVLLSIRPERALILRNGAQAPVQMNASVSGVVYVGDHLRVSFEGEGLTDFIVKMPNRPDQIPPAIGEQLKLGWQIKDCIALEP